MPSLHRFVNEAAEDHHFTVDGLTGAGAWATVTAADHTAKTVAVAVDAFDGGDYLFGPVPYYLIGTESPPIAGDTVWLTVDSQQQPAFALLLVN